MHVLSTEGEALPKYSSVSLLDCLIYLEMVVCDEFNCIPHGKVPVRYISQSYQSFMNMNLVWRYNCFIELKRMPLFTMVLERHRGVDESILSSEINKACCPQTFGLVST
jgi:hypothetical protein